MCRAMWTVCYMAVAQSELRELKSYAGNMS